MKAAALLGLLLLTAGVALAQPGPGSVVQGQTYTAAGYEYPMTDWRHRFTMGASLRHHWYAAAGEDPTPQTPREFAVGAVGAYSIVPHLTLVGGTFWGFDSRLVDTYLGISVPLYEPPRQKVAP